MEELIVLTAWFICPLVLLWAANEAWYASMGRMQLKGVLISGLIGVPLHELSHALTATLFGMRVTEIKLYKPDPQSNSLGYVNYQYRPGSPLHQVGRFFTGFAPAICGGLVVWFGFRLAGIVTLDQVLSPQALVSATHSGNLGYVAHALWAWGGDVFAGLCSWVAIATVIASMMVALHATPSKADLAGAAAGSVLVLCLLLLLILMKHSMPEIYYPYIARFVDIPSAIETFAVLVIQMAVIGATTATVMTATSLGWAMLAKKRVRKRLTTDQIG